jgi:DNA-binding response OmpR family regulator
MTRDRRTGTRDRQLSVGPPSLRETNPRYWSIPVAGHESMPNRPLILIVDPDDNLRDLYANWLIVNGFDVMCAAAVDGACWALKRQRPDLVITELVLRRGTGVELLLALQRSFEPPISVLVMTSSTDRVLIDGARSAGAVAVVPKLAPFEEIRRWVDALTEVSARAESTH